MSQTPGAGAGRRVPVGRFALRTSLWLLLGGWVGAWMFFGAVVAPTAFRTLPSTEIAGTLVGPILTVLHLYGAAAGVGLALLAQGLGRGLLLRTLPLAMSALCLYTHFGVTAEIAEIRDLAFGSGGSSDAAVRFRSLHELSLRIFIGLGVAALGLTGLHSWADTREAADP